MGGGVALTLSHELDTLLWLKNELPQSHFTLKSSHAALQMDADNITEVIMRFEDGSVARAHMNYVEKKPNRRTVLLFENGRLTFEYFKNTLVIEDFLQDSTDSKSIPDFDRNDLFISETQHFFKRIENNDFTVDDGLIRACEIVKICTENE
jgi:predicted dehydrogenase